jgi:G:T-mismatch repair DNA endonuclease (very short patch repair protein)
MTIYVTKIALEKLNFNFKTLHPSNITKKDKNLLLWLNLYIQEKFSGYHGNLASKIYMAITVNFSLTCPYGNILKYEPKYHYFICKLTCSCTKDKKKKTNLEKYGTEYPIQNTLIKEKRDRNFIQKYGVKSPQQIKSIKEKTKNTMFERYGNYSMQTDDAIEKFKEFYADPNKVKELSKRINETKQNKYGTINLREVKSINEKIESTNLKRYGHKSPLGVKEIQNKVKETLKEKYGVTNTGACSEIRKKQVKTYKMNYMEKYGVIHPSHLHIESDKLKILNDKELFTQYLITMGRKNMAKFLGVCMNVICVRHRQFALNILKTGKSSAEQEISDFLDKHNIEHVRNSRDIIPPRELDIYLPQYKIAIEYNGDYWHANPEKYTNESLILFSNIGLVRAEKIWEKDAQKQMLCENKGIKLLVVWENNWEKNNEETCKKLLNSIHEHVL